MRLPRVGLDELLRGWSGEGHLFDALSAVRSPDTEWSTRDIARRANRVLLGRIEPEILALPRTAADWIAHLPVDSQSGPVVANHPIAPVRWGETARRFGWPSRKFVSAPRTNVRDETTLTSMAWTAERLDRLVRSVASMADALVARVQDPVDILASVVREHLPDVTSVRPNRLDLLALMSSGRPWAGLAEVARSLSAAETDLDFLAYEIIEPDAALQWRLFHLSTLGAVIGAFRARGARIRWLSPLSGSSAGPNFRAVMPSGTTYDIWFEAHGAMLYYQTASPYRTATAAVARRDANIGVDILVIDPGSAALALECKWSDNSSYVGRDGFHQASGYALELRNELAPQVKSYVVGPAETVPETSELTFAHDGALTIGVTNIGGVDGLIAALTTAHRRPRGSGDEHE